MRKGLLWLGLVLSLAVPNLLILRQERQRQGGEVFYLQLAPRDPRSLIQGDYMQLGYGLVREIPASEPEGTPGVLVVKLDGRRIAHFSRWDTGEPLQEGELRLRYTRPGGAFQVAPDAYHFQEGQAARFSGAKHARVRVTPEGECLLLNLTDEQLKDL